MRIVLALAAIISAVLPSQAHAESHWRWVADVQFPYEKGNFIAQVDLASMRRSGTNVTYWVRVLKVSYETFATDVARGPALYEDNCTTNQLRVVQGNVLWGYDGPAIPLKRPAEWQFIAPDSLADSVHDFVCKSQH